MKNISTFLSWIFHPLLMVTFATIVYFFLLPSEFKPEDFQIIYKIIGLVFVGTFLLPVFAGLTLKRLDHVSTMEMENKEERNWPLLLTSIIYVASYYALNNKAVPSFIQLFLLGSVVGIIFSMLVNLKWKISLHMIGAGGFCGGIFSILLIQEVSNPVILAICILISGILGTARLYLNAHTPLQILAGFISGFAIEFGIMQHAFS